MPAAGADTTLLRHCGSHSERKQLMGSRLVSITTLFVITVMALPGFAQQGDRQLGIRLVALAPEVESETFGNTGTGIGVDDTFAIDFHVRYRLYDHLNLELSLLPTQLDLATVGGVVDGLDAGNVLMTPLALTMLYQAPVMGKVRPYIGAGLCYTYYFHYELTSELYDNAKVGSLDFGPSLGMVGQIGLDFELSDRSSVNLDVRYLGISTDIEARDRGGNFFDKVTVDINPWALGLGVEIWF
jgi:outer membrane protein